MNRGIFVPLLMNSTSTHSNPKSTSPMMPCKRTFPTIIDINPITKCHIKSFKDIWIRILVGKSITLRNKYYLKWNLWEQMLPKVFLLKYHPKIKWITFKYSALISWLTKTFNHGLFKSTLIHVLIVHAPYLTELYPIWLNNHSN